MGPRPTVSSARGCVAQAGLEDHSRVIIMSPASAPPQVEEQEGFSRAKYHLPSRSTKVKGSLSQPSSRAAGCTSRCP